MDYEKFYDMVREEIQHLMEMDMYKDDYRLIKALAALYELQDYLANRVAELEMDMECETKKTGAYENRCRS